jgi:hypothetical protein
MNLFGGTFHHVPLIDIVLAKKLPDSLLLIVSDLIRRQFGWPEGSTWFCISKYSFLEERVGIHRLNLFSLKAKYNFVH